MKIKKIFFILIILIIGITIATILFLEIFSRIYKCEASSQSLIFSCLNNPVSLKEELLVNLRDKRMRGEKISKEEYRQAAEIFILEVDPKEFGGYLNGIACKNYGYVRNDLPKRAKKYVRRHELEHLLQTGKEKNYEFSANFAAGKEYPLGLIETIFFSLKHRAEYYDSPICYILSLWKIFKTYFYPFSDIDL